MPTVGQVMFEGGDLAGEHLTELSEENIAKTWQLAIDSEVAVRVMERLGAHVQDNLLLGLILTETVWPPQIHELVMQRRVQTQTVENSIIVAATQDPDWDNYNPQDELTDQQATLIHQALVYLNAGGHKSFWELIHSATGDNNLWRRAFLAYGRYVLQRTHPDLPSRGVEQRAAALAELRVQLEQVIQPLVDALVEHIQTRLQDLKLSGLQIRGLVPGIRSILETQQTIAEGEKKAAQAQADNQRRTKELDDERQALEQQFAERRASLTRPLAAHPIPRQLEPIPADDADAEAAKAQVAEFATDMITLLERQIADWQRRIIWLQASQDERIADIERERSQSLAELPNKFTPGVQPYIEMEQQINQMYDRIIKDVRQSTASNIARVQADIAAREKEIEGYEAKGGIRSKPKST
jgi:hypothetical protein